jgi:transposase/DNA-binding transcriptional regulator YdaS (Cro superfamily)
VDTAICCVMSGEVSEKQISATGTTAGDAASRVDLAELLASSPTMLAALQAERAAFAAERATFAERVAELETERDNLRASHERLREELDLFKRRLFIAKAERADTEQLKIEFEEKLRKLDELAGTLGIGNKEPDEQNDADKATADAKVDAADGKPRGKRKNNAGTGRRKLRDLPLEEERIEIPDPHLEKLVAEGKVKRHGFDETPKLGHKRGGKRRIIIARVRYKTVDAQGDTDVISTPMPAEMLPGAMAAPSLAAHVIMENIGKGLPLFRIEDTFAREGIPIDRGTLCRWKKRVGDGLAVIVKAMQLHAFATAFCIATDATGICVQAAYSRDKGRQPCKKGHFLVQIADKEHIFFEYLERETSANVSEAFFGSVAMYKRTLRTSSTCSSVVRMQSEPAATTSSLMVARARRWGAGFTAVRVTGKQLLPRASSGARRWRVLDASSSSMRRGVLSPTRRSSDCETSIFDPTSRASLRGSMSSGRSTRTSAGTRVPLSSTRTTSAKPSCAFSTTAASSWRTTGRRER